jgi:hypothetical protein
LIRVVLPFHLQRLAKVGREVQLQIEGEVTQRKVLDALEARFPVLKGTIRDRETARRRALLRFLACGEDLSDQEPDAPLPDPVARGQEPYIVLGSIAGG